MVRRFISEIKNYKKMIYLSAMVMDVLVQIQTFVQQEWTEADIASFMETIAPLDTQPSFRRPYSSRSAISYVRKAD